MSLLVHPIFVTLHGGTPLRDENAKRVEHDKKFETALLLKIVVVPVNVHERVRYNWTPILLRGDGKVVQTYYPYRSELRTPTNLIAVLSHLGLYPHIDMDPLVERCFDVGYTSLRVGPGSYGSTGFGAFGINCSYDKENEPRINLFPAIWSIVGELELSGGAGGHHSSQLTRFVPVGKRQFGEHKK